MWPENFLSSNTFHKTNYFFLKNYSEHFESKNERDSHQYQFPKTEYHIDLLFLNKPL